MRLSLTPGSVLEGEAFAFLYRFWKGWPDFVLALSYLEHKPEIFSLQPLSSHGSRSKVQSPSLMAPLAQGSPYGLSSRPA